MRVVLDTNILISARHFGGKPGIIFDLITVERQLEGATSPFLLNEYYRVLREKFQYDEKMIRQVDRVMRDYFTVVEPETIPDILIDKPDNNVIAVVDATDIDVIISGDNLVLDLKEYKGVPIMTPTAFLARHPFKISKDDRFHDNLLNY